MAFPAEAVAVRFERTADFRRAQAQARIHRAAVGDAVKDGAVDVVPEGSNLLPAQTVVHARDHHVAGNVIHGKVLADNGAGVERLLPVRFAPHGIRIQGNRQAARLVVSFFSCKRRKVHNGTPLAFYGHV